MKTVGNIRKLFLLLCLITAGAQGVWAGSEHWGNTRAEVKELTVGNVVYELCYTYDVTYYLLSYDFDTGVYTTNVWVKSNEQYYASAVRVNLSSGGPIVIEDNITDAGVTYPVKYVGLHTEEQSVDREVVYEWYEYLPTYIVHNDKVIVKQYKRIQSPTTINSTRIQSLTVKGNIEFKGDFTASSCHTAVFQGNVTFSNSMGLSSATQITFNGGATISSNGTLWVGSMSELRFNKLVHEGKIYCPSLTDIYFTNNSSSYLPVYSGAFSNYFAGRQGSQITCHLPQSTTESRIQQLKATAVFCDFKDIIAGESKVNYTITSDGNARINFVELKGNASYVSATGISQIASASSGSKSGTVKSGGNYAVEIRDVDFDTKKVSLLRNGSVATLEPYEDQGQPLRYHEDLDLQQDVRYEVSVSDKVCTVSFAQTGYTGRIMYQKTWNGTTSTGVITAYAPTVTCAQGSQLKLTIPYDQYTPNVLRLNGSTVSMTKANGEATATITVPAAATAEVDLTWQAPQQTYETHQPQIMIMRSGEGQVTFKGAAFLSSEWQQYIDDYEQSGLIIEEGAEGSWVISGNGPVNCSQTVNTVTAPDVDPSGDTLDESSWGFIVEMTPVAGQKLKTFLIGQISGGEELLWDDMLFGDYSESNYITYNESTNTYTFDLRGDYMNYAAGDYIVNIVMGPEETAVETGKTLNFVRQGGRGDSFIEWYDESGRDFYFEEGSTSKTIPNEELQDNDLKMYIDIEQGEALHVYKNGADITSQFQLNGQSTTQYWLLLKPESATYTLLIDDAPNANPTWTIHNATEADVIVEQTLKNGTTETVTYAGNLNDLVIDDTQVSKVTLKVYAENANEAKPVRVLKNGQDVSYQFSTMPNDGDGFRLCYEVPVSELTNCSWDISYNTDHQQTFVVKGGSRELLVDFEREILYGGPVFSIFRNDGPATIYLPPFNSEYNSNIDMVVYANAGEGVTIKRNGVDVTALFEEKAESGYKYYDLDINDADFEGDNTVSQFGFDIRDAAVWEITIDDGSSDAVEYMFIGDYDKVYASADYNNDVDYEGFEFTQQNVEGYYAGKVVEKGTALGKQGAVEFWLPAGKTFRAFYDGTDMTNQFTDYYNNGHWLFVSEDDWIHLPGHHWTIIAESDLMKYDTNRDGSITIADVTKLVNEVLNR